MADEYEVIDAGETYQDPNNPCWYVVMRKPDGTNHEHAFPKGTLEWRAAEYGLTDPAEIIDGILHARLKPRQAARAEYVSFLDGAAPAKAAAGPVRLWEARSTAEAREGYRQQIAATKAHVRVVPPKKGPNPLDVLLQRHGMTADGIRSKLERVDTARWISQYGDLPAKPTTEEAPRA